MLQRESGRETGHEFQRKAEDAVRAVAQAFQGYPVYCGGDCVKESQPVGGCKAEFGNQNTSRGKDGIYDLLHGAVRPRSVLDCRTVEDAVGVDEGGQNLVSEMRPLF